MTVDPRDYDVGELRDADGHRSIEDVLESRGPYGRRVDGDGGGPGAGPPVPSEDRDGRSAHSELLALERAMGEVPERPYLQSLPSGYDAEVTVLEWVEYLVRSAGPAGARSALQFYRSVGWIDHRVQDQLVAHTDAVAEQRGDPGSRGEELSYRDHEVSLTYVARLTAIDHGRRREDAQRQSQRRAGARQQAQRRDGGRGQSRDVQGQGHGRGGGRQR